ncbi:hypothetical protein BGW80DRAFT_1334143 [Lactifluus volemus]|nr:hypothetical protein BGW80DRAFT_1334143 [Lactifluus volemus]
MLLSSPAIDLAWSILSCLLGIFFLYHLWSFDRFKCMRWNSGSNAGFKRFMTYTYFTGVPLIITYSIGFCAIKYSEGYISLPKFGTIAKPPQLWTESHQRTILPLQLCAAFAWGLELVTHLETLCFSIFLINSASSKDWFQSWYFRSWAVGSFISVLYIPLVTLLTGSDPIKCEIFTALAGSSGSLLLTICSVITMRKFVPFVERLRREGVCMTVLVRLTKFRELSTIYIFSRILFAVPLFILSADGAGNRHFVSGSW